MRIPWLTVLPSVLLLAACSDGSLPNTQLTFSGGLEGTTFDGVARFTIERLDANGTAEPIYDGVELPKTLDAGASGSYRFRATGHDENDEVVVRGETLMQDISLLRGGEIPLFLARTDRTTTASGNFLVTPGERPKVVIVEPALLWMWTNESADSIATDAYSFAYWQQVSPQYGFDAVPCAASPCGFKTLVMVGGYFAIAMADTWARLFDKFRTQWWEFPLPEGLGSFANVTGGRMLPGADDSAFLIGGTRTGEPTAYTLGFDKVAHSAVRMLATPRAGAATLYEADHGILVVGGSEEGAGVERMAPNQSAFVALNYPPDPVTGAALVVEDPRHAIRVGGQNADGTPADTLRIDVECSADLCEPELLADQTVAIVGAESFRDPESGDSIIVGEDPEGLTLVYRYRATTKTFIPIPIPDSQIRTHATAIELPTRQVALVGGSLPEDPSVSRSIISVVSF